MAGKTLGELTLNECYSLIVSLLNKELKEEKKLKSEEKEEEEEDCYPFLPGCPDGYFELPTIGSVNVNNVKIILRPVDKHRLLEVFDHRGDLYIHGSPIKVTKETDGMFHHYWNLKTNYITVGRICLKIDDKRVKFVTSQGYLYKDKLIVQITDGGSRRLWLEMKA